MGQRCHIADSTDIKSCYLQGPYCCLPAGAGAFHLHLYLTHTMFHGLLGSFSHRVLGGKRCTLSGTLEPQTSGTAPGNHITQLIGNGNNCIVECRLNVDNTFRNILFFLAPRSCGAFFRTSHLTLLSQIKKSRWFSLFIGITLNSYQISTVGNSSYSVSNRRLSSIFYLLLTNSGTTTGTFTRPGIGTGALTATGQSCPVTTATVTTGIH